MKAKPRAQFCWLCGRKLRGRIHFAEMVVDGHSRILHKRCAKLLEEGQNEEIDEMMNDYFQEHQS